MSMRIFEGLPPVSMILQKRESRIASLSRSCFRRNAAGLGLTVLALLSACNSSNDVPETTADVDGKLYCSVDGAAEMTQSCPLERIEGPEGQILVVHHPEGGFRRFRIVRDGRGIIPADGAEPSKLFIAAENKIDIMIGGDRYRFPATIGPKAD